MPVQGGNAIDHNAALAGMVADLRPCATVSKLNGTGSSIPFGTAVVSDGDDGMKVPVAASTAANFIGAVKRELNRANVDGDVGATDGYDATVVTHGVIWVTARVAVAKDDPVYVVVSDGTGTNQGEWSNVVGAAATLAVQITDAKWLTSAGAGELAQVSLGIGG